MWRNKRMCSMEIINRFVSVVKKIPQKQTTEKAKTVMYGALYYIDD